MPKYSAMKFIIHSFRNHKRSLWYIALFSSLINLLILFPSIYMLQVYDRVLPSRNEITLIMLSIMVVGALGMIALLEYCRSMITIWISKQVDDKLSRSVYQAAFIANLHRKNQDTAACLNDVTTVRQFFTGNAIFAFIDAPWFPVFILVIFLFNPLLGLFALAGSALLMTLALINHKLIQQPLSEAGKLSHQSTNMAGITLRHASTIEAMGLLPNFQRRWWAIHEKFIQLQQQASEYNTRLTSITRFTRMSLQSLILGLGGWLTINGQLTPGMMIAGSILLGRALAPIEQLIIAWKQWGNTRSALIRLDNLLASHPTASAKMALPTPQGRLDLKNVALASAQDSDKMILNQITFSLNAGEVLGIIGASASGKSTLAQLILGLQPATSGTVRIDGADIRQWDRTQLGPSIGYLSQEVEIFPGSIAENIARFNTIDANKVIEAAKLAGVHEMILRLPGGYDTLAEHGGVRLSGGQKQRIALARALYDSPKLVVLDEPDASLDDAGIIALAQALTALQKIKTTVILITHRKQLLSLTHKVLVMQEGRIGEFGETRSILTKMIKPVSAIKQQATA
ncbi:type I secretion system permease/ATPase [Jejubacter calystegiae]|uniref:Type I secretion system permease/ATPase n=1 Tax=Jejubacter calystegiae TaxID=2579935 RepID=A0A4P8YHU7_9ENTR|nr:type I secretion system permease/ATPase [Jejubacter calystegiae]QCT19308.1 type I secretion system permease/ATPase [Jejubacter calystegiae]